MRLLIVDDEPLIRAGIQRGLKSIAWAETAGACGSVTDAVARLRTDRIDLVLLDVQLPDGTAFDVIEQVGSDLMPNVIFITAYDNYAIQAFELNAIDYLLKPFDDSRLHTALVRAKERLSQTLSLMQQLESLLEARASRWLQRVVVRNEDRIDLIPVGSIDWIESANNYTVLHCSSHTHILAETLSGLEDRLDPKYFLRIHRRRIVQLTRIVALHPQPGGVYDVELSNGIHLTTGRQYRDAIQVLLRNTAQI